MLPFRYVVRSIYQRKSGSLAALVGTALVVVVFATALMIPKGIERISARSQHPDIAIVLSRGASTETESTLDDEAVRSAVGAKEVSVGTDGRPAAAPEITATILLEKLGADSTSAGHGAEVLVRVRGLSDHSLALRPEVKVVAGRAPAPGTSEAMVGRSMRGKFAGLELGQSFELARGRPVTVVGAFESGGTEDSEVFVDTRTLQQALKKEGYYSSVRVKVPASQFVAYKAALESQQIIGAEVQRETDFVAAQYGPQAGMMMGLGVMVSLFFGIGGIIGALITMHSAIANRSREIGTLRALGFSRWTILTCVLMESVLITLLGGAVGALLSVAVGRIEVSVVNVLTLSEMVFSLRLEPEVIGSALMLAVMLGLMGGIFPAVQASRIRPVDALRK